MPDDYDTDDELEDETEGMQGLRKAKKAAKELSDPAAFYLPRIDQFQPELRILLRDVLCFALPT